MCFFLWRVNSAVDVQLLSITSVFLKSCLQPGRIDGYKLSSLVETSDDHKYFVNRVSPQSSDQAGGFSTGQFPLLRAATGASPKRCDRTSTPSWCVMSILFLSFAWSVFSPFSPSLKVIPVNLWTSNTPARSSRWQDFNLGHRRICSVDEATTMGLNERSTSPRSVTEDSQ